MAESEKSVPVWTLTSEDTAVPEVLNEMSMTPDRLIELRTVLSAMAGAPIATLEAHPVPEDLDRSSGLPLDNLSPLAVYLSELIGQVSEGGVAGVEDEVLYRMVVPAKFAAQVGGGLLTSMASKAVDDGIHSALMGSSGIAGQATFVRATGAAGTLTVAAPLIMMAVAAGVSMNAEHRCQQALDEIRELLRKLTNDAVRAERSELNSCVDPIDKATAILLDKGEIGQTVDVGVAAGKVNVALATARERLKEWQHGLEKLGDKPVEIAQLRKYFNGIDQKGGGFGEFGAHLRLAEMAIALKKRVIVLQAVEHAQQDPENPFRNFVRTLKDDQEQVIKLESEIAGVKQSLGKLRLDRSHGIRDGIGVSAGDVDHLLRTAYRLRDEFGAGVDPSVAQSDVAVEIARNRDGSVVVFPALTTRDSPQLGDGHLIRSKSLRADDRPAIS